MKPTSATDETLDTTTDNWSLLGTEAKHSDDGAGTIGTGTNLCKEQWIFSNSAFACVKVTGTVTRDMKVSVVTASNPTADTLEDFDFDFVDHSVSTQFGKDTMTMTSATMVQFAAVTVPFATFLTSETAGANYINAGFFAAALALFTAF